MKSRYIKGLVSEPHYENFETLWSAQFEIPNIYVGTLYINSITASKLCRTKRQRIPFIIGKKVPYTKQGLVLNIQTWGATIHFKRLNILN